MTNHSPEQKTLSNILPPFPVNKLFKFSAQGSDLAPSVGNGTKVKISYEIGPPLKSLTLIIFYSNFLLKLFLDFFSGGFWEPELKHKGECLAGIVHPSFTGM